MMCALDSSVLASIRYGFTVYMCHTTRPVVAHPSSLSQQATCALLDIQSKCALVDGAIQRASDLISDLCKTNAAAQVGGQCSRTHSDERDSCANYREAMIHHTHRLCALVGLPPPP